MKNNTKEQLELINQQIKEIAGIYQCGITNYNISTNEFWIWYSLLLMKGDYSQQDICCIWSLSKQTVNTIITQMVRKGFVMLKEVEGNRNKKIIQLTKEGKEYGESIVMPIAKAEQRAFEKLSIEDRVKLSNILSKYIEMLKGEIYESNNE